MNEGSFPDKKLMQFVGMFYVAGYKLHPTAIYFTKSLQSSIRCHVMAWPQRVTTCYAVVFYTCFVFQPAA